MPASILQERQNSGNASVSNISIAFSSNLTAGSCVHAIASQGAGSGTSYAFTDTINTYTTPTTSWDATESTGLAQCTAKNVAAGPTTVKVTFGVANASPAIWVREVGGVTTNPVDGSNINNFAAATAFSLSATNASQPALVSALMILDSGANTPSATSGTQDVLGWTFGGATSLGVTSHQRVTTAASQTASFSSPGSDTGNIAVTIFDELPAATYPMPTQIYVMP
jgi:hypothetical protein